MSQKGLALFQSWCQMGKGILRSYKNSKGGLNVKLEGVTCDNSHASWHPWWSFCSSLDRFLTEFHRILKLLSHKTKMKWFTAPPPWPKIARTPMKMKSKKDGIFEKNNQNLNSYCTRSSINCKCCSREIFMTNRLEHGLHIGIYSGVPLNGQPKWHLISISLNVSRARFM